MAQVRAVMVAAALVAGIPIAAAPDAGAAHKDRICDAEEVCLWKDANASGCIYDGDAFAKPGKGDNPRDFTRARYVSCPNDPLNDSVSSYRNGLSDLYIVLYEHVNQAGASYCIGPGASGNVPPQFNDRASSMGDLPGGQASNCTYQDRD